MVDAFIDMLIRLIFAGVFIGVIYGVLYYMFVVRQKKAMKKMFEDGDNGGTSDKQ